MALLQRHEESRKSFDGDIAASSNNERGGVVGFWIILEPLLKIFGFRQQRSNTVEKFFSFGSQLHALVEPNKKLAPEFFLKKLQLLGYRGLTDVKRHRCLSNIPMLYYTFKDLQLMQCHRLPPGS